MEKHMQHHAGNEEYPPPSGGGSGRRRISDIADAPHPTSPLEGGGVSPQGGERAIVATFYHFVDLPDYRDLQPVFKSRMAAGDLKGSILLSPEGINATISGPRAGLATFLAELRADPRFAALEWKESTHDAPPFQRAKVRLKKETITFGLPLTPETPRGVEVAASDWNNLISDPDVTVIDTRNDYEVQIGSFARAENPGIQHFTELKKYTAEKLRPEKNKKIAMFCTGGVRCEKYSAYLLEQGFPEVYQLKGGILKYLETVPESESLWQGSCFVFDERVGVGHGVTPTPGIHLCPPCGTPYVGAACPNHPKNHGGGA